MIRLIFECPVTGEPLTMVRVALSKPDARGSQFAVHCPACARRHRFARADAVRATRRG
jgi:hypothetical protein